MGHGSSHDFGTHSRELRSSGDACDPQGAPVGVQIGTEARATPAKPPKHGQHTPLPATGPANLADLPPYRFAFIADRPCPGNASQFAAGHGLAMFLTPGRDGQDASFVAESPLPPTQTALPDFGAAAIPDRDVDRANFFAGDRILPITGQTGCRICHHAPADGSWSPRCSSVSRGFIVDCFPLSELHHAISCDSSHPRRSPYRCAQTPPCLSLHARPVRNPSHHSAPSSASLCRPGRP